MSKTVAKYQKYAEYKDSGVEWLPTLPKQWKVERVKRMLSLRRSIVGDEFNKFQLLSLTLRGIIPRDISNGDGKIPESFNTYQQVHKDDLVFCLFDMDETPRTVGIAEQQGMITGAYNVYASLNFSYPKYLYYYFLHLDYFKGLKPFYTGLRKVVRADTFSNIEIPCPSVFEQTQIANFLDYETAKIDSLIEKQQQLIQLLKEKRQAVISHAVTKGLNPNVLMRDSGVEWLGEVPEHWNTLPLKLCVQTRKGVAFKAVDFCDAGIRVVKASDIKQKTIRESETFLPNSYVNEFPKAVLHTDDLILSTVGSTPDVKNSAVGQIGKVPQSLSGSLLNQNTVVFSSTEILDQNFLYYLVQTNSYRDHLDLNAHGTANQASLNISDMLNFMISIPELNEQVEIKNYLDKKISKLEELELKILAMSISLNERRTALISAAVTGKIDVRNWQNPTEAKMEFSA